MRFQESLEEAFPYIQQILSDTYHTDTWLFAPPYDDFNKIDRGFRQMVWHKENFSSPLQQAVDFVNDYHLIVIQSSLDFYNIIAFVTRETAPSFITIGPFRDREMTETDLSRIMQTHRLPSKHMNIIRRFYYSLPIADLQSLITTFCHLMVPFLPQYEKIAPEYIIYSEDNRSFVPNDETIRHFSYDEAEHYAFHLNRFLDALLSGSSEQATDTLRSFLDCQGYSRATMTRKKSILSAVNTHCCCRMLTTQIHPSFILERYFAYDLQIQNLAASSTLQHLPYEIARKYCLMVKNYSFLQYSYLIRNVMNYITLHLSEDLSLSVIAAFFQKNPSYLSGQFRKETGESLSIYIQKERMQAAIRYFNTTNMSVAEVAGCVGIHDFGYFSRIFKKHIGQSPSQYRKLVKT